MIHYRAAPRDGVYISGLYMEGARWDIENGCITDCKLRELLSSMPVIYVRGVIAEKQDSKNVYECPVYRTQQRDFTYVSTFNLKTRDKPSKWVLAGVALLLSA